MAEGKELAFYKKKCKKLEEENRRLKSIQEGIKSLLDDRWLSPQQESPSNPIHPPEDIVSAKPTLNNTVLTRSPILGSNGKQVKRQLFKSRENEQEQRQVAKQDSFDRIPLKESGPSYLYKDDKPARGKKRKALPGQTCTDCEEYYKAAGIEGAAKKCSKHRSKQPRLRTPPGYWGLDFPSTQELRARQSAMPSPEKY